MTDAEAVAIVAHKQRMLMPCRCGVLAGARSEVDGRGKAEQLVMRGLAEWHFLTPPTHSSAVAGHVRLTAAGWALAGGAPLWVAA